MNPNRSKHIIVGLVIVFILFLFYRIGDDDYSYEYPGAQTQGPIPTQPSYRTFNSEQTNPYSSKGHLDPSSTNRNVILQTKVKGYRESTYWGESHPTYEKVRHMSDDEFDRFIEEVEISDADAYWGASY